MITFKQQIFSLLTGDNVGIWSSIKDATELKIQRITSAMSNFIFLVENCSEYDLHPRKIVLRIYGEVMNDVLEKNREIEWMLLFSRLGLGAKIYGVFENGRFEEYFDSISLTPQLLCQEDISMKIAKRLAKVHRWIDKLQTLYTNKKITNELWKRLDSWFADAEYATKKFTTERLELLHSLGYPNKILSRYIRVKEDLMSREIDKLVFAHCDLQYGNILLLNGNQKVIFIDFEYACFTHPAFDVANHWCEWAADYTGEKLLDFEKLPSSQQKQQFVRNYFIEHASLFATKDPLAVCTGTNNVERSETHFNEENIEKFVELSDKYIAISHLLWGLWGILLSNNKKNDIEFDYFSYAVQRLKQFNKECNKNYST